MPYKNYQDKVDNSRLNRLKWRSNNRCCHCGSKLPDKYTRKNCLKCIALRNLYYWKRKYETLKIISGLIIPECKICKITDLRVLTINHINGNGTKNGEHGNITFLNKIINGKRAINDLDIRCHNHNILYEFERGTRKYTDPYSTNSKEIIEIYKI